MDLRARGRSGRLDAGARLAVELGSWDLSVKALACGTWCCAIEADVKDAHPVWSADVSVLTLELHVGSRAWNWGRVDRLTINDHHAVINVTGRPLIGTQHA